MIHDLWESHATLQDIDSKHSSSRYFASSSNGLCARILALFFFPSKDLFQSTQFNGDKMFTKIKQLKNIGHRARSWAKDHCTSLPGPWTEKNNTVFSKCARAHSTDYVILMCNTGRAVQN